MCGIKLRPLLLALLLALLPLLHCYSCDDLTECIDRLSLTTLQLESANVLLDEQTTLLNDQQTALNRAADRSRATASFWRAWQIEREKKATTDGLIIGGASLGVGLILGAVFTALAF